MSKRNKIRVREVMTDKFRMMDGMATVRDGLNVMSGSDTSALIVDKRTEDDAYGIVLLSDIARKVLSKNKSRSRTNLYEIMSKPVLSVEPDLDIRYCARLFDRFGLSLAPVVDQGKVIGIVSYEEIVLEGLAKFET
ncbi:MAG: CBS domain-containing protein [Gammaproteobacteria bacterium]|nr:CBS domain-containing protein [Gammaproteobacteria bacterium]